MGGVAEQLGALGAQCDDLLDDLLVVVGVVAVAAHEVGAVQLLAQVAPRRILQEGGHGWHLGGEHPFARPGSGLGRLGAHGAHAVGQAGQSLGRVDDDARGVGLGQQVLAELQPQQGELAVELAQAGFPAASSRAPLRMKPL